jgi:hypothetical protein
LTLTLLLMAGAPVFAQAPPDHHVKALASTAQSPVGDLASVPFQFNFNSGRGLAGYDNVVHPSGSGGQSLRISLSLLYPRKP